METPDQFMGSFSGKVGGVFASNDPLKAGRIGFRMVVRASSGRAFGGAALGLMEPYIRPKSDSTSL